MGSPWKGGGGGEVGDDGVAPTVKKQYGRVRLLQVCLTPPRTGNPCAHPPRTLRLRTLRFFSPYEPDAAFGAHRPRFNLHTTDHVFRLAFTSSSPYLTTIDQAPIVFASTHPPLYHPRLDAFVLGVARWSLTPTRTSLMRAHRLCVALQQSRISLTSGSPSTDDIVST